MITVVYKVTYKEDLFQKGQQTTPAFRTKEAAQAFRMTIEENGGIAVMTAEIENTENGIQGPQL